MVVCHTVSLFEGISLHFYRVERKCTQMTVTIDGIREISNLHLGVYQRTVNESFDDVIKKICTC